MASKRRALSSPLPRRPQPMSQSTVVNLAQICKSFIISRFNLSIFICVFDLLFIYILGPSCAEGLEGILKGLEINFTGTWWVYVAE